MTPAAMTTEREVSDFLKRWAAATERRDAEGCADLFLRDPAPLVTFSDGERANDWLDVRVRLGRDFERAIVEKVELHEVRVEELPGDAVIAGFEYDLTVRDMWGQSQVATRHATFTLTRTKDGFRIAAAHFGK